jgi:hypothetical protein
MRKNKGIISIESVDIQILKSIKNAGEDFGIFQKK